MKAVSAETMRSIDALTIRNNFRSGIDLMRAAGRAAANEALRLLPPGGTAAVFAGKGNNGGDGFVIASCLTKAHCDVRLFLSASPEELKGDAKTAFHEMPTALQTEFRRSCSQDDLAGCSLLVDAMLGTGFSGKPRSPVREWIDLVNHSGIPVLAVDIPSGLDADNGSVPDCAVTADVTVTFALPKAGLLLGEGPRFAGRIHVAFIGIPKSLTDAAQGTLDVTDASDIRSLFGREPFDTYKNSRGHVLVIGGSRLYGGAPLLAACAALRSGAGLVSAAVPDTMPMRAEVPKALMIRSIPAQNGIFPPDTWNGISDLAEKASAVVAGPGMSSESVLDSFLRELLERITVPLVLDADALNRLAANRDLLELLRKRKHPSILTPHEGEMRRLLHCAGFEDSLSRENKIRALTQFTNGVVILKGPHTLVTGPDAPVFHNLSGCTALATAGSGDVLSGIAAALLARGNPPLHAARAAVYIHGLAGELAAPAPRSGRGVIADDLLNFIPSALRAVSPFA